MDPYRGMERFHTPSLAQEMREAAQKAVEDVVKKRMERVLAVIKKAADIGLCTAVWPEGYMKKEICDEVASVLSDEGFICEVQTYDNKWWRKARPGDAVWDVLINW